MRGPTHAAVGANVAWLALLSSATIANPVPVVIAAVIGALLPDIDKEDTKIRHVGLGNITPFESLGRAVNISGRHRGITHSLVGVGVFALISAIAMIWLHPLVWLVGILGYASHLVLDSATPSGIRLLWPKDKRFYLLPVKLQIQTSSSTDDALGMVGLVGIGFLLLILVFFNQF